MENYSSRKYVALRFDMNVLRQWNYLGSNIARRSASVEQIFLRVCIGGQAKVYNNGVHTVFISEHYIFGFQVSMHYSIFMHVA